MVTLSKSFCPRDPDVRVDTTKPGDENEGLGKIVNGKVQQQPQAAFKRLHILYLAHEVLCYVQRHASIPGHVDTLEQLRPDVHTLVELAVCGCDGKAAKTCTAVMDLLAFWKDHQIFTSQQIDDLRDSVLLADETDWDTMMSRIAKADESKAVDRKIKGDDGVKWIFPDRHGAPNDPVAPWHELPAANGLYMKRTRGYPLRASSFPQGGIYLRNGGEKADPQLKKDVLSLYNEVLRCYDHTNAEEVHDVDALGNIIWKDPERPTRNYWGFTLDGVDRRKELAEYFAETANGYDDYGQGFGETQRVTDAVERARLLAAERGRGMGRGRGNSRGWIRGGRGWTRNVDTYVGGA